MVILPAFCLWIGGRRRTGCDAFRSTPGGRNHPVFPGTGTLPSFRRRPVSHSAAFLDWHAGGSTGGDAAGIAAGDQPAKGARLAVASPRAESLRNSAALAAR